MNKLDYTTKVVVIGKDDLDKLFAYQDNKRKIRSTQVSKLIKALEEGGSFPRLSVNSTNPSFPGKYVIIDGNHRETALRKFFDRNPEGKVQISLDIYQLSDEDEEREKFRVLNSTITPSSDDFLQQYKDDIPLIKRLLREIPRISIYGSKTKPIKLRPLLSAYLDAINPNWSPSVISGMDLIYKIQNIKENGKAFREIKAFLHDYQEWFGDLTKESIWLRTTALNGIMRIWYVNKERMTYEEMFERMRKVINHNVVIRDTALGGRTATEDFTRNITDVLNNQRKRGKNPYTTFVLE